MGRPRILVLGTGALGTLFTGRLARSGASVAMAGTWREALAHARAPGVRVEGADGSFVQPIDARDLAAIGTGWDLALVLVKSAQTRGIAPAATRATAPGGLVVTLQNGLGNREALAAAAPGRVAVGVVTLGAALLGPGHVRATPGHVQLEDRPGAETRDLHRALAAAGFDVGIVSDVDRLVWRKLVVSCSINPVSAWRGVPNGALLESAEDRATLEALAREVAAVAAARGTRLDADPLQLVLDVARETASNRSSMLQDVSRGAPTEIEALNGAVVREARRLGVAVPANERVCAQLAGLAPTEPARVR